MTTDTWDAWIRILRDVLIVVVGSFMLVYETVFAPAPNAYVIGAGLAALGLPPALRLDLKAGRRSGGQTGGKRDSDRDDLSGWGGGE